MIFAALKPGDYFKVPYPARSEGISIKVGDTIRDNNMLTFFYDEEKPIASCASPTLPVIKQDISFLKQVVNLMPNKIMEENDGN